MLVWANFIIKSEVKAPHKTKSINMNRSRVGWREILHLMFEWHPCTFKMSIMAVLAATHPPGMDHPTSHLLERTGPKLYKLINWHLILKGCIAIPFSEPKRKLLN